ncbi:MAG: hypothetical protein KAT71_06540 [Gammaproteobacteria bacterium]|nr:hypothetical protein [Gammaproteobacteria bacterium]
MKLALPKQLCFLNKLPAFLRIGLFLLLIIIVFGVWKFGFWNSLADQRLHLNVQSKIAKNELRILNDGLNKAQAQIQSQTIQPKLATTVPDKRQKLVSGQEMTKLLKQLLLARHDLELVQFYNLPEQQAIGNKNALNLYEHGVVIKFRGSFFAVLRYLEDLEDLPWQLFWDKLEYQVTKYPVAEVTLQVHTLSMHKGWLNG